MNIDKKTAKERFPIAIFISTHFYQKYTHTSI